VVIPGGRDLYVIGAAALFENRVRALVDAVLRLKNNTMPDIAEGQNIAERMMAVF